MYALSTTIFARDARFTLATVSNFRDMTMRVRKSWYIDLIVRAKRRGTRAFARARRVFYLNAAPRTLLYSEETGTPTRACASEQVGVDDDVRGNVGKCAKLPPRTPLWAFITIHLIRPASRSPSRPRGSVTIRGIE